MNLLDIPRLLIWGLAGLNGLACGYLLLLTAASLPRPRRAKGSGAGSRFAVIVPAHNEEQMIAATIASLKAQDYAADLFAVHVIADNCDDATASIAAQAGAIVHERNDRTSPGKGQALSWLMSRLLQEESIDAFAFVDADTTVEPGFLAAMDRWLASGESVLQANYRVQDPGSHPLVGLRALAFALIHGVRGRGKGWLGLSCGLWGNGMVVTRRCLIEHPWRAHSSVEDAEQHIRLVLEGLRSRFVAETRVYGYMPASLKQAVGQQRRWEGGRLGLLRRYGRSLLHSFAFRGRPSAASTLIELLLPPLSVHLVLTVSIAAAAWLLGGKAAGALATGALAGMLLYIIIGFTTAGLPARTYKALLYAPGYIVWKAWLFASELLRRRDPAWVRTGRGG